MTARQAHTLLAACLLAVVAVAYWYLRIVAPVELPGSIVRWNQDLYAAYYPVFRWAYRSPELLPGWNPRQLAGTPFLANANGILYPPNFVALLIPIGTTLGLLTAFHLALGGIGAFRLSREVGASVGAALVAGVAFMLGDFLLHGRIHPSHLAGFAWIPWVALAAARVCHEPGFPRAAWLGAAIAVQVSTGSSQMVLYTGYGVAVACAAYLVSSRDRRPGLARVVGWGAVGLAIGIGLAAVQIVPTLEAIGHATRGRLSVDATLPSVPSARFVHSVLLASGPVLLLAVAALADPARRSVATAAAAAFGFALLFGLGTQAYREVFFYLPLVDRFRQPNRMLVVGQLAAAVLVAIGIDTLRTARRPAARLLGPALVIAAAVGMHALGVAGGKRSAWHPDPMAIAVAGVAAILAWLPWAAIRNAATIRGAAVAAVLAIAVVERFVAPANQLMGPEHNDEEFFAPPPFVRFLRERAGDDRILVVRDLNTRFPLTEKAGTLFDLNVVQDYEPLAPRIYQTFLAPLEKFNIDSPLFWGRIYPPARDELWRPLDMLAVRYVVAEHRTGWLRQSTARFREVYRDDQVTIYENLAALPRALVVRDVEVVADPDAAIERVLAPGFDPRRAVVLDTPAPADATPSPGIAGERVEITEISADEVRLEVAIPRSAILVLADLYWPGWRVFVDGKERPLRRANGLFRGVALEAGSHDVRFIYSPASVRLGAATSLVTVVLVAVGAVLSRRRQRVLPRGAMLAADGALDTPPRAAQRGG